MFSETIELRGHIIDSLILPKVLDQILTSGGNFKITEINIGRKRADQSFARIEVSAETGEALDELILRLRQQGAEVVERANAQVASAPTDGVFPSDFYVTTNQQTFVRLDGKEIEVRPAMINSAIALDRKKGTARAVKFYDVKRALFGTSLGANPDLAVARGGHENHLRAINTIREAGGISPAVHQKILTGGILHACIRNEVDIVLTGGIRDEGPIPGVTTDVIEAQKVMRTKLADVTHIILLATLQHSLAVASMLAPDVKTVCVDIDPPAVEKAIEHQPLQSIGLVTDVEPFLRELADCLTDSCVRD